MAGCPSQSDVAAQVVNANNIVAGIVQLGGRCIQGLLGDCDRKSRLAHCGRGSWQEGRIDGRGACCERPAAHIQRFETLMEGNGFLL